MTGPTHTSAAAAAQNPGETLALEIVRRLRDAGHVAYFAGGCVRDRLMGRPPKDFDVATDARPDDVLRLFPRSQKVGVAFGVVIVRQGKAQVEVATFRSEGAYSDGRRPDSVSFTTPEIDAQRRDFTCNGLFYDPLADAIHDFVGGRADIAAKVLRAIGDAHARFGEDHLRMIRAVRFAARLGFSIDPATWAAIRELAPKIRLISRERVGEELRMILAHDQRLAGARMLHDSGLLAEIWPAELYAPAETAFRFLSHPGDTPRPVGLAAMQLSMSPPADADSAAAALRGAFMLSNEEHAELAWLFAHSPEIPALLTMPRHRIKRMLADARWPGLWRIHRGECEATFAAAVDARIAALHAEPGGVAPPPFVTGDDLIALGARPGREFKSWLETLYDRQLDLEFSDRPAALAAARALFR